MDTIYALSTPPGQSAIAIVRISGAQSREVFERVFRHGGQTQSHRLYYGDIVDEDGVVDEAMAVFMAGPNSYTREDMAEFHCHGSMAVVKKLMQTLDRQGLRLAQGGEFSKRAFLSGRIDLAQAEAVMDLIASSSERGRQTSLRQMKGSLSQKIIACRDGIANILAALEVSIDYPEEMIDVLGVGEDMDGVLEELAALSATFHTGRMIREGVAVAIVGRPNVGKSSLLNALVGSERAIVTEVAGTTRDVIEEPFQIDGMPVRLIDTAGIREGEDPVEKLGVARSFAALREADVAVLVLDTSRPLVDEDRSIAESIGGPFLIALNKSDGPVVLPPQEVADAFPNVRVLPVSAATGDGLHALVDALYDAALERGGDGGFSEAVVNQRHQEAISRAREAIQQAKRTLYELEDEACVATDLRIGWEALGEIVGETATEDLLDRIFSQFCLGK
ncbi:MAG: tRNA uridine-5-carboxymethylaminomethyl(34) synthesis GTPase MnmE [Christensenellales bacterium]|jgi:tRNA modification GTPase